MFPSHNKLYVPCLQCPSQPSSHRKKHLDLLRRQNFYQTRRTFAPPTPARFLQARRFQILHRFNGFFRKADFDSARAETGTLMVVDFFATWCGPCKAIAPQVVKMSSTYPSARFYKIDVDEVPEVAQELSIRAMPTFVLFKDGQEVATVVGANPTALEAAIKQHV
ncbi:hypothetical protein D6C78_04923 [Aureobasidium pullulans]|uniref:Thioredoxin domain-containing protein n=1 Tax=Aureobasidium pullulans TaxID=5580 RepID=A0A4T0BR04_AURPU|nr:hypothetical protein D6C78_04923 [Aureobasidium pullulans]